MYEYTCVFPYVKNVVSRMCILCCTIDFFPMISGYIRCAFILCMFYLCFCLSFRFLAVLLEKGLFYPIDFINKLSECGIKSTKNCDIYGLF